MTTWSVVKDDTREKQRRNFIPRIALLVCLALVVLSLGIALSPGSPEEPAEPPFSEQARSAALAETVRLRAAGEELAASTSGDAKPAVAKTVSLLTSHARALLVPGQDEPALTLSPGPATASAAASAPVAAAASVAASPSAAAPGPASAAALATELAASASQRLSDAAVADGGQKIPRQLNGLVNADWGSTGNSDDESLIAGAQLARARQHAAVIPHVVTVGKQRDQNVIERHGWTPRLSRRAR